MRGISSVAVTALVLTGGALVAAPAYAASPPSVDIDFTGYSLGDHAPAGQNGWTAAGNTSIDWGLHDGALRFSNAVTDGAQFQLLSPPVEAAGESEAHSTFTAPFTVASQTGAAQNGLVTEVDVSNGDSARIANINLRHSGDRLMVGTYWVPEGAKNANTESWQSRTVAAVDATTPHTISVTVEYVKGGADILIISVDGVRVYKGDSWENYYEVANEKKQEADRLLFRAATSVPSANGIGYDAAPAVPANADRYTCSSAHGHAGGGC